ncbi:MAG: hypothetical protein RI928_65 [Pseudomonadota bacterium]
MIMRSARLLRTQPMPSLRYARKCRQRGAVAIVVAISLIAMVGIVGLALDLGKMYVARAELQNAADACALAAVHSLNGATTRQLDIAEAAGLTAGLRHKVQFQSKTVNLSQNASIAFAEQVEGPWRLKNSVGTGDPSVLRMRHARCTIAESGMETWFIHVLNALPGVAIGTQQVSASAVASLLNSQTTCALPVAICVEQLTANPQVGQWIKGVNSPSDDATSNFRWVDLSVTGKSSSTRDIADMLSGNGACELPVTGMEVGTTGARLGLSNEWNTRFGLYQGGAYSPDQNPPDLSGYAYTTVTWPANKDGTRSNAFQDFIGKRSSNTPYQGDALAGLSTGSGPGLNATLVNYGSLRRVAPAPVVSCSDFQNGTHKAPIQYWACMFMLHPINRGAGNGNGNGNGNGKNPTPANADYMYLEYRGKASDPDSPCASMGLPGDVEGNGPLVPTLSR